MKPLLVIYCWTRGNGSYLLCRWKWPTRAIKAFFFIFFFCVWAVLFFCRSLPANSTIHFHWHLPWWWTKEKTFFLLLVFSVLFFFVSCSVNGFRLFVGILFETPSFHLASHFFLFFSILFSYFVRSFLFLCSCPLCEFVCHFKHTTAIFPLFADFLVDFNFNLFVVIYSNVSFSLRYTHSHR